MKAPIKLQNEISKIVKIKNNAKRDLISILWSKNFQRENPAFPATFKIKETKLDQIIKKVESLDNQLFPPYFRPLGKYAEELVGIFLNHHPDYQLLAKNIQLIENKITLGEIDFLLFDKLKKEHLHLEFAIKFYLKVEKNGKTHYIGPNTKDSLERKVTKLKDVQLPLLAKHAHLLTDKYQAIQFKPQLLFKTFCFFPIEEWEQRPQDIFNEGWWAGIQDWQKITSQAAYFQIITQKSNWIPPFYTTNRFFNKKETAKILTIAYEKGANHFMLIRLTTDRKIMDRGFIMRKGWPK